MYLESRRTNWRCVLCVNPLSPELNPICYLPTLLAHDFLHVSRLRIKSLNLRLLMSYIYIYIYIYMEHLFLMFLDHTQRRSTVGRTPLDEWSVRPEESYRLCCVVVCDLETSRRGAPYIYDISNLRVNYVVWSETVLYFDKTFSGLRHKMPQKNQIVVPVKYRTGSQNVQLFLQPIFFKRSCWRLPHRAR
jgi:hypothetical protein